MALRTPWWQIHWGWVSEAQGLPTSTLEPLLHWGVIASLSPAWHSSSRRAMSLLLQGSLTSLPAQNVLSPFAEPLCCPHSWLGQQLRKQASSADPPLQSLAMTSMLSQTVVGFLTWPLFSQASLLLSRQTQTSIQVMKVSCAVAHWLCCSAYVAQGPGFSPKCCIK